MRRFLLSRSELARRFSIAGVVVVTAALTPSTAGSQGIDASRAGPAARFNYAASADVAATSRPFEHLALFVDDKLGFIRSPTVVTVASALVPGAGQALLRQRRSILYLALESVGIGFYVSEIRDGSRQRDRYREISRATARAQFSPTGPQGNWDYYERMEKYVASGVFDAVAGGAIEPESDVETYNGSVWLLARQTYWRDPAIPPAPGSEEYQAALRFYSGRAITSEFRWSWLGSPEAFQKYRASIAASNSSFRKGEETVGLVIANHFLSAVDAYVSVHAHVARHSDGSLWIAGSIPVGAF